MALGKAFIEVHADTKPFARQIGKEIDKILRDVEKETTTSGKKLGENVGDGIASGVRNSKKKIRDGLGEAFNPMGNEGIFQRFAKGIVDTLDDGLSGLPAEVKALLGASLIVIAPIAGALIGAAVAAAIVAALTIGLAGIGVVVAAQFTEIQNEVVDFMGDLRDTIVADGQVLFAPMMAALIMFEDRLMGLRPIWQAIFGEAAKVILPVVDALLGFAEQFAPRLAIALGTADEFTDILGNGLREIGREAGNFLAIIATDDDAKAALSDILMLVRDLIFFTGALVAGFLDVYGAIRQVFFALDIFGQLEPDLQMYHKGALKGAQATALLAAAARGTASALEHEEKALAEVNKAIEDYINDSFKAWTGNINFEQSLDDMSETLKKHRGALNLDTQAGRDNQSAIKDAANALLIQRANTINLTGDTEKASATFATNTIRLRAAAAAAGITGAQFDALTKEILSVPPPISPGIKPSATNSVNNSASAFRALANAISAAVRAAKGLKSNVAVLGPGGGFQGFADGGIVPATPGGQIVRVGEGGSSETIIPNNDPGRAMQLLNQSGLSSMFTPVVNVFVGNAQLDAYIDSRAHAVMTVSARDLAYGTRGI